VDPSRFTTPLNNVPSSLSNNTYNTLQLKTFSVLTVNPWGWWSPECKPAIYLYPQKETKVSVKVKPKGYLTYTDPKYPIEGWQVTAFPNGNIKSNNRDYDYLYYESKIRTSEINKPANGFVVTFSQLPNLYSEILPKLGLSEKETIDFKEYWEKTLPYSPYYFVGIMNEENIEKIEPLTVDPKPHTIIRVRLYFEALNKEIKVDKPELKMPKREGFILSEWGGIVKVDKDHAFTCSQ